MHCGLLVRSLEHCEGRHLPRWQAKVLQSLVATHALRLGRCFSPCGGPLPLGSPIISVTSSPTVILLASLRLLPPRTLSIIIFKIRVTTLIRRFSCKLWVSPFCPHLAEGVEKIFRVVTCSDLPSQDCCCLCRAPCTRLWRARRLPFARATRPTTGWLCSHQDRISRLLR